MKKKNGFTLIELIIVVTLLLIIVTTALAIYGQNNRIVSETNIKSTLQTEAQNISQKVIDSAMGASGIVKLTLSDGSFIDIGASDEEKYSELTLVDSNGEVDADSGNNQWISVKEITINNKDEYKKSAGNTEIMDADFKILYEKNDESTEGSTKPKGDLAIIKDKFNNTTDTIVSGTPSTLSNNVASILIRPKNLFSGIDASGNLIKNVNGKISDANSIELVINLSKKKGVSDIKYSIPITVTFRNKEIS